MVPVEKHRPNWPEELLAVVRGGPLALFVGSGVSRDEPSLLPTGDELRDALFDAVVSQAVVSADLKDAARAIVRQCRPESLLYLLDEWQGADWKKSLRFMLDAPPNANHKAIARIAATGKVQALLTTNFDCLLERALESEVPFRQIFEDDGFGASEADGSVVRVLKLHGSLSGANDQPTHETILASLVDLANRITPGFSNEKARLLDQMLCSHVFVFVGYSGRDELDIQPIIKQASARGIVWVSHTHDASQFRVVRRVEANREELLDPPGRLMLAHADMIRVYANTSVFLSDLCVCMGGARLMGRRTVSRTQGERPASRRPVLSISKSPFSFLALLFQMAREWKYGARASELALADTAYTCIAPPHILAELHRNRGVCLKELGRYRAARGDFERALSLCERAYSEIYQESTDTEVHQAHFSMMSQIHEDLALTDLATDDLDQADQWINKAVAWSKRLTYPRQITFIARNYANASLIAKAKFEKTGERSELARAIALAKGSEAGVASGSLIELVRSMSNLASLSLVTQNWDEALSTSVSALALADQIAGPHGKSELRNLTTFAVVALCGLAPAYEDAVRVLESAAHNDSARPLPAATFRTCLDLFGKAWEQGLCFAETPEAAAACLEGIFALVFEEEEADKGPSE